MTNITGTKITNPTGENIEALCKIRHIGRSITAINLIRVNKLCEGILITVILLEHYDSECIDITVPAWLLIIPTTMRLSATAATIIIYIIWPCGFVDDNNIHSMAVWFCER